MGIFLTVAVYIALVALIIIFMMGADVRRRSPEDRAMADREQEIAVQKCCTGKRAH